MARPLKALTALPKDPVLIPSTHIATHNCNSSSRCTHTQACTRICRQSSHIQKKKSNPLTCFIPFTCVNYTSNCSGKSGSKVDFSDPLSSTSEPGELKGDHQAKLDSLPTQALPIVTNAPAIKSDLKAVISWSHKILEKDMFRG